MTSAPEQAARISPRGANGFKVGPGNGSDLSVAIWGELGLGWFGRVATALARRGLSILSATASLNPDDTWSGHLELAVGGASVDPHQLDYLALCDEDPGQPAQLEASIARFRLERTETNSISLRLFAADRLGFLSSLLERFEFLGLFPVRLRVSTENGFVDDTLLLRGVAGHPPSPDAERALSELLSRLRDPSAKEND